MLGGREPCCDAWPFIFREKSTRQSSNSEICLTVKENGENGRVEHDARNEIAATHNSGRIVFLFTIIPYPQYISFEVLISQPILLSTIKRL
jgi:hypothetical protein